MTRKTYINLFAYIHAKSIKPDLVTIVVDYGLNPFQMSEETCAEQWDNNGLMTIIHSKVLNHMMRTSHSVIYTYEDVELRRIFPSEFPQDTVRKSGSVDPEHLGRYAELKSYFRHPKTKLNSHFEELACYDENGKKVCRLDEERYSPEEEEYYTVRGSESHVDRRRVYCLMLLCFTEDELDRVVASF